MTQLLSLCLRVALGTASFAEVLICGGDFHLCGGLNYDTIHYPPGMKDKNATSYMKMLITPGGSYTYSFDDN